MDHSTEQLSTSNFNRRLLRRAFLLALIPAVVLAGKLAESAERLADGSAEASWTIQIEPARPVRQLAMQEVPVPQPATEPPRNPFAPVAPAGPADPAPVGPTEESAANQWGITIVPQQKVTMNGLTYRQAYESIPFSRSMYLANPAYRHDAAMELLTGVPRQSVHSTYEARLNDPIPPQPEFHYNNYGDFGTGVGPYGGFGFFRGVYPPAFRYFLPLDFGL